LTDIIYICSRYTVSYHPVMPKIPDISDAEWKVMQVLWNQAPLPAYDIVQILAPREDWHPNTIKTLLARLVRKKALGARRYKNLFLYHPLLSKEDAVQAESETFLERCFGGAVEPLLAHFARRNKLTVKDLDRLRNMLKEP
jgi:BlaI family transcriptional regulator, penicillinase repressor